MIGMTSVTFRKYEVEKIIKLCQKANVDCIEWGGDVHVKSVEDAQRVVQLCKDAKIAINSYGSYFKVGKDTLEEFEKLLDIAHTLGAKVIRVWCGEKSSCDTQDSLLDEYVVQLKAMCTLAAEKSITVACEYHNDTFNDNANSALTLIDRVNMENYKTYWQTVAYDESDFEALKLLKKHIAVAHVFTWDKDYTRYALSYRYDMWQKYINEIKNDPITPIIEFVRDDSKRQFIEDAKTLRTLYGE